MRGLLLLLRAQEADHRPRRLEYLPQEVEGALLEHPDVANAGVIGIHDLIHGENVRAYITFAERPSSRPARSYPVARARVGYKAPEEIVVLDQMPSQPREAGPDYLKQMAEANLRSRLTDETRPAYPRDALPRLGARRFADRLRAAARSDPAAGGEPQTGPAQISRRCAPPQAQHPGSRSHPQRRTLAHRARTSGSH